MITIFDATHTSEKPVLQIAMELRERIMEKKDTTCLHYLLRQKNNVKIHRRAYKKSIKSIILVDDLNSDLLLKELFKGIETESNDISLVLLNDFPETIVKGFSKACSDQKTNGRVPEVFNMCIPENLPPQRRKKFITKMVDDFMKQF